MQASVLLEHVREALGGWLGQPETGCWRFAWGRADSARASRGRWVVTAHLCARIAALGDLDQDECGRDSPIRRVHRS